ncbi:PREDICTED: piggyBac transposable element-derived protein 3-like [Habropoda laboriosa]|uniref:piggyBac transposable element-derived protein 3-like n=1 Tax=Habropoda laboriosa TaxID=597456 RepID=UPI00083D946E|nr:PREDICTED: piggyBac transposable element-derived protein 3-like [Habropoda laboriosa]
MGTRKFFTLAELEDAVNDPNFFESDDDGATVDIVELPPDKVDIVSDIEDTDENTLEDSCPKDVPGRLEVHSSALNIASTSTDPNNNNITRTQSLEVKAPVEVFETVFDEEIMTYIVRQSVTYAAQNNRHSFTFSTDCLRKFIGFLLLTGYHSLAQEQMYWCEDEDLCIEVLVTNKTADPDFKMSPLIKLMNQRYLKFGVFSKNISIDEQMVRYYGHRYFKQFIGGKPIRFGFKQWTMCCAETGYCYHTELYTGKRNEDCELKGLGESVIMKNTELLENPSNHVFYFDNFFTSFQLMKTLKEKNILATGTVRSNRLNKCPIKSDYEFKNELRGSLVYRFDMNNEIFCVVWKDNKCVKVLSNHQGIQPLNNVTRWSKSEKKQIKIDQPYCISNYNKFMGGIDKLDWNVNKYRIKIRGKKWYFPIFTSIIDTTVVNAYVLYCHANKVMPLLEFRRNIARAYLQRASPSNPKNRGRPSLQKQASKRVPESVRTDPIGHYLERTLEGKQRKCAVCKTMWGKCHSTYSDNGTNFVGARNELNQLGALLRDKDHNDKVRTYLAQEQIEWHLIPPHAPHFRGLWESAVKSVKTHLKRVTGEQCLTFD